MSGSEKEFDEARLLWRRVGNAFQRRGASACPGANDLAAYLDGLARGRERDEIEGHLGACSSCRAAAAEIRALLRAGPSPAPAGVVARAKSLVPRRRALGAPEERPAFVLRLLHGMGASAAWAAAAAAVAAACTAGFMMGEDASAAGATESVRPPNGHGDPILAEFGRLEITYLRGSLT